MYRAFGITRRVKTAEENAQKLSNAYYASRWSAPAPPPLLKYPDSNAIVRNNYQPAHFNSTFLRRLMKHYRDGHNCTVLIAAISTSWLDFTLGDDIWYCQHSTTAKIVSGYLLMQTAHQLVIRQSPKSNFAGLEDLILRLCPHLVKSVWNLELWGAGGVIVEDEFSTTIDMLLGFAAENLNSPQQRKMYCPHCSTVVEMAVEAVTVPYSKEVEYQFLFLVWQDFGGFEELQVGPLYDTTVTPVAGRSWFLTNDILQRIFYPNTLPGFDEMYVVP